MINTALGKVLNEMADILELNNDNVFRIRAMRRSAEIVEAYSQDMAALTREELLAIPGIGKGTADIIEEFKAKGSVKDHEKLKKLFPEGVLQMMRLQGLGPRRAAHLFKELKIDSIAKLAKAAESKKLEKLKGFGPKLQESLLKNIAFVATSSNRILLGEALVTARLLEAELRKSPFINQLEKAGSLRRWKETVGDFDFLCTSKNPTKAIEAFLKISNPTRILASGDTKASVNLLNGFQCDFRVVDEKSFGAALLYFTGSKEHNVRLRELAQTKGLTLNEYGLFKVSDKNQTKPVASKTEEEIYQKLGMAWIPPELREDRGEIEASLKNKLPKLVTEKDIKGDFHNHTDMSDGEHTLEEMVEAARQKGWEWFFSADHSPSLTIAHGLPVSLLKSKMKAIEQMNKKLKGFKVFCGSEVDILANGDLDYPDAVLAELGCVVASVHSRFNQPEAEMTDRICNAIKNKNVDILGHLTGRRINKREPYALDIEKVLSVAKETQTAIEINGQPERSELRDIHVKRAIELGVPLCLTTDAHSTKQLDHMELAVHIARRGWAEPQHLLNCLSISSLLEWLKN